MKARNERQLTLEEVVEHFERWREEKQKGERIPDQLWCEAVGLVGAYGVSEVTRRLRLSGTDLNKRRGVVGAGKRRKGGGAKMGFVEVERAPVVRTLAPAARSVWMEVERPDGLRLRIQPTGNAEMLALLGRFMGS